MKSPRTSPTQSQPERIERLGLKFTCAGCPFSTTDTVEAFAHNHRTGHAFSASALSLVPFTCRCGRTAEMRAVYLCNGCNLQVESCTDCTRTAIERPQLVHEEPASSSSAAMLPDAPPQALTLGDEMETLGALLGQVLTQTDRVLAAGAMHLGPLHVSTGLEALVERLRGSVEMHGKHLAHKRRELAENRGPLADMLRDLAQKAAINGNSDDSRQLATLAQQLPQQLPEGVRHD